MPTAMWMLVTSAGAGRQELLSAELNQHALPTMACIMQACRQNDTLCNHARSFKVHHTQHKVSCI